MPTLPAIPRVDLHLMTRSGRLTSRRLRSRDRCRFPLPGSFLITSLPRRPSSPNPPDRFISLPHRPFPKPLASGDEPLASRGEPLTSRGEPLTSRGEPPTSRGKPLTSRGEPPTSRGEPLTSRGEPLTS